MKKLMKVFTFIFMVTVFFTACSDKSKETGEVKEKEKAPAPIGYRSFDDAQSLARFRA